MVDELRDEAREIEQDRTAEEDVEVLVRDGVLVRGLQLGQRRVAVRADAREVAIERRGVEGRAHGRAGGRSGSGKAMRAQPPPARLPPYAGSP